MRDGDELVVLRGVEKEDLGESRFLFLSFGFVSSVSWLGWSSEPFTLLMYGSDRTCEFFFYLDGIGGMRLFRWYLIGVYYYLFIIICPFISGPGTDDTHSRLPEKDHDVVREDARELMRQIQEKCVEYDPDRKVRPCQIQMSCLTNARRNSSR